jgi:arsenate reductase
MTAYNVLFLCTGNSARSILAEAIVNGLPGETFRAFSAGSAPRGEVNPHALSLLQKLGHPTDGLRSKSWDEFAAPGAPDLHFIITVCDNAAGEACPVWPGKPITAHWGLPDPAEVDGAHAEIALAFAETYRMLGARIDIFRNLPLASLDKMTLQAKLRAIGERADQTREVG